MSAKPAKISAKSTEQAATPKATRATRATTGTADVTQRQEVESVQALPAGKIAVVTLRDWLPASGMVALREQLHAATGHPPVILPPGATIKTMTPKAVEAAAGKDVPQHDATPAEPTAAV